MINLMFTKFFDVKSPLGLTQNEKEKNAKFHSVGVDMYMPILTDKFIAEILKNNKDLATTNEVDSIKLDFIDVNSGDIVMRYFSDTYFIHKNIQIPTGIGILIPEGYNIDIRSKSSNYKNYYTSITGLIDENYTYGMGVQIVLIDKFPIVIKPNEKFAQIELKKSNFIEVMTEIDLKQWENLDTVKERRENRKGGFGSSKKFD